MNKVKNYIQEFKRELLGLSSRQKKDLLFVGLSIFSILFSYPLVRATSTAIFLDAFGAKSSPYVWLYSVIALSFSIFLFNKFQKSLTIHKLVLISAIASSLFLILSSYLSKHSSPYWAYALYIWKEVYIVLLIHSVFGFLNSSISESTAKLVFGPVGAMGSIGGIVGGFLTSYMTKEFSIEIILSFGSLFITLSGFLFWMTDQSKTLSTNFDKRGDESPLESIKSVKKYVFLIALVVTLSQFIINLVNFQFNIFLSKEFVDKVSKTEFLGVVYSFVNVASLFVQFLILPLLLKTFSIKSIHRSIPTVYSVIFFFGVFLTSSSFIPLATAFALFKGLDYSLFSASKEMLYFALSGRQKYGAKYVVDMIVYRSSKGLISVILIFFQSAFFIKGMLSLFLITWFLILGLLFKEYKKIHTKANL